MGRDNSVLGHPSDDVVKLIFYTMPAEVVHFQ
jgi:hypothetical protein